MVTTGQPEGLAVGNSHQIADRTDPVQIQWEVWVYGILWNREAKGSGGGPPWPPGLS
jgi:hypothetical protein